MADVTEESGEIDDFAIFRARSLGVESEYLVLAKAGQLRGSPRVQRDPAAAASGTDQDQADPQTPSRRRHASGSRPRNLTRCGEDGRSDSPSSLRENSCSPKVRRAPPYTRSDSTKTETLETRNELFPLEEEGRLQRAHSYRSRRSPQPQLGGQYLHGGPDSDQTESSKFNRSRTMTMPARRKPVAGRTQRIDPSSECSSPARRTTGATGSRSSFRGAAAESDANGNRTPSLGDVFMDRAVLRVRNFSTKSGNIVNRGDSIKIRGGRDGARSGGGYGGGGGGGGGTRPPSLRNENGGIGGGAGQHETPLASPVRPSLSRHSSRGSYKYHASETEYVTSPEVGGGGGGMGVGGFPSSPSRSSHNLLCPLSYPLNGAAYTEENEEEDIAGNEDYATTSSHLKVNCGQGEGEGGRRGRVVGTGRTEAEEETDVYKVLVLGSQGVGKTTLTKQLLTSEYLANNENDFDDETSDKIVSVQVDDEESMLQFMDAPTSQPTKDYDTADANLVVYSVTDRPSFSFAQSCLQELRPAKRHNVVILVANKQDIVRNRIVSEEDGKNLAAKRHCKFIEVSALLNHKTDDLLVGITRQIRLRKAHGVGAGGGGGPSSHSPDDSGGGPVGCLQRVAMEAFRKLFKRRQIEATSCDDLFTP